MQWAQNENRSQFLIHIERGKKTFYVYHLIHWVKSSEAPTRLGGCHIEARRDPTQGAASDVIACTSMPCLSFFFFSDSHRLNSIRVDLASIHADSARSGPYQSNRVISADDRNRLKLALNHAEIAEIGFEWVPNILNLSFINFILNICCFFCVFFFVFVFCFVFLAFFFLCFVNQDHSNVFFKNILIVKIYRKYK